jgi:glycosyltransferase involved in cell wall biosynthesis
VDNALADRSASNVETRRPSVALLVDDLVEWLDAGMQPTGIQRVVTELLDTAMARSDLDAWPATSGLVPIDRERLRPRRKSVVNRSLRAARGLVLRVPMPMVVRTLLKSMYSRLLRWPRPKMPVIGGGAADADLVIVPGSFWVQGLDAAVPRIAATGVPVRAIVYDLISLTNPEWFDAGLVRDFTAAFDRVVPVLDRIVTISGASARELVARYPETAGRIRIAVPGLEAHRSRTVPSGHLPDRIRGSYLLAVGTVEPRKNYRLIVDAWRVARRDPRLEASWLVIAGRAGWLTDDLEDEIALEVGRSHIERVRDATDGEIEMLYAGCQATVHASWTEGFGLPARESVVRGIPTLVSTSIPLDGLPLDRIQLFDPRDRDGLAELIVEVLANPRPRTPVVLADVTGWEPVLEALLA